MASPNAANTTNFCNVNNNGNSNNNGASNSNGVAPGFCVSVRHKLSRHTILTEGEIVLPLSGK
ncbi:hypothetical protein [uncultured Parasutterella sp.]|uniref:hypothetical protein n=1 Tax=uncultured Parasutterella sp. TaxID=1263098 RepID=UPI0035160786